MVKVMATAAAKPSITSMATLGLSSFAALSKVMDESPGFAVFFFVGGLAAAGLAAVGLAAGCAGTLAWGWTGALASGWEDGLASVCGFGCRLGFEGGLTGFEGAFT